MDYCQGRLSFACSLLLRLVIRDALLVSVYGLVVVQTETDFVNHVIDCPAPGLGTPHLTQDFVDKV